MIVSEHESRSTNLKSLNLSIIPSGIFLEEITNIFDLEFDESISELEEIIN